MTDREVLEHMLRLENGGTNFSDASNTACGIAADAIQELIDRETGCDRCYMFEHDPQFLFSRGNGMYDEITFKFCPVCGKRLNGQEPGRDV